MSAGILSLATWYPERTITNDYFRERYPESVRQAEQGPVAKIWTAVDPSSRSARFDAEMAPFLSDPFRGFRERRRLAEGEPSRSMELGAVRRALDAAHLAGQDIDALICTSFLPDIPDVGNAAYLARDIGMRGPAWNLEATCSSPLVGLQTACALLGAGDYRRILYVGSCCYSRATPDSDSLAWANGDGAVAFVVGPVPEGDGVLSSALVNTCDSCGALSLRLEIDGGVARERMFADKKVARAVRDSAEAYLRQCVQAALDRAGVELEDIRFFAFTTPTAWYARFCAHVLGIPLERTLTTHALYANVGPALTFTNLFHAAHRGLVARGDLVLLYVIGTTANAGAAVVRWGDVALGPISERELSAAVAP